MISYKLVRSDALFVSEL